MFSGAHLGFYEEGIPARMKGLRSRQPSSRWDCSLQTPVWGPLITLPCVNIPGAFLLSSEWQPGRAERGRPTLLDVSSQNPGPLTTMALQNEDITLQSLTRGFQSCLTPLSLPRRFFLIFFSRPIMSQAQFNPLTSPHTGHVSAPWRTHTKWLMFIFQLSFSVYLEEPDL